MKKILTIGEILVEIMADTLGDGFREPIPLTGPFPSGAPAIFIDQVAKLGQPAAIISAVGDDDFGRVNTERLSRDGVDIAAVAVDTERPTGSAFVRYRADGNRDFVYNIRHSACGTPPRTGAVDAVLESADHLHVMGSSLSSPDFIDLNLRALKAVKARGGTVSFDPNIRKEILHAPGIREAMVHVLRGCDLFLPSGDELTLLTQATTQADAIAEILDAGTRAIVHKRGVAGVTYHDKTGQQVQPAFKVEEVDPTGAGDCFGATFVTLWLRSSSVDEALTLSAAAGALAVTRRGPMEGASDLDTLHRFAATQQRTA